MTNREAYSFILIARTNVREVVAEFFAQWAIARSVLFRGLVAYVDRTGWVGSAEVKRIWFNGCDQ